MSQLGQLKPLFKPLFKAKGELLTLRSMFRWVIIHQNYWIVVESSTWEVSGKLSKNSAALSGEFGLPGCRSPPSLLGFRTLLDNARSRQNADWHRLANPGTWAGSLTSDTETCSFLRLRRVCMFFTFLVFCEERFRCRIELLTDPKCATSRSCLSICRQEKH